MSKSARNKHRRQKRPAEQADEASQSQARPQPKFRPPLPPSRRLLFIAAGLFTVWLAFLMTLYVTAVLPEKQKNSSQVPEVPSSPPGAVAR